MFIGKRLAMRHVWVDMGIRYAVTSIPSDHVCPPLLCQRHRLNTKYDVCFVNRTWNYFPDTPGFPLLWTFFLLYFSASLVTIESTEWIDSWEVYIRSASQGISPPLMVTDDRFPSA